MCYDIFKFLSQTLTVVDLGRVGYNLCYVYLMHIL